MTVVGAAPPPVRDRHVAYAPRDDGSGKVHTLPWAKASTSLPASLRAQRSNLGFSRQRHSTRSPRRSAPRDDSSGKVHTLPWAKASTSPSCVVASAAKQSRFFSPTARHEIATSLTLLATTVVGAAPTARHEIATSLTLLATTVVGKCTRSLGPRRAPKGRV